MLCGKQLIICFTVKLFFIGNVNCNNNGNNNITSYAGEYFPDKYLEDDIAPTVDDLNNYINGLSKVINYYLTENLNKSIDINKAISVYFMRGILKRTIMDYWETLDMHHYETLLDILKKGAIIWSYFVKSTEVEDVLKPFAVVFDNPMTTSHSVGDFKSNSMKKWIKTNSSINTFLEDMDKITFSKEEYASLQFLFLSDYHIRIPDSDFCLALVKMNPEPTNMTEMTPCKPNPYCYEAMSSSPSVAYTLSHRIVNLLVYRLTRRCYFDASDRDEVHIESLCAQMYRESVYIARRGFFSRDMFMEHVGLCAMMGYKEFFRRNWFNKMNSWIDQEGCIAENRNFVLRRLAYVKSVAAKVNLNLDEEYGAERLDIKCADHLMAVYTLAISSAIREAAHHVASTRVSQLLKVNPHWVSPLAKINHI